MAKIRPDIKFHLVSKRYRIRQPADYEQGGLGCRPKNPMPKSAISNKLFYPLATFAVGVLIGVLAFGERPSHREIHVNGTEDATISAMPVGLEQTSPTPDSASSIATELLPKATAAVAASSDEPPAPFQPATADGDGAQRLQQLEQEMSQMSQRILLLEQALVLQQPVSDLPDEQDDEDQAEEKPADTPERRQEALIAAGLKPHLAADIVWQQSQRALERLEIQDLARREGWFGSDRYFDELSEFEASADDLQDEIGDRAYDRYLFDMGKSNRVMVDSVIQGSPAAQAGVASGDVIISYADERLFGWSELREATAAGERGETVRVRVLRGQDMLDFFIPRGPLGVRLDTTRMEPLE